MTEQIMIAILRESVSLFVLLLVLVGGYRLTDRLITVIDNRLGRLEQLFDEIGELFKDFLDEYNGG